MSALLTFLFALPTPAVTHWRESHLNDGRQIWIEAGDFDRRENETALMRGSEAPKAAWAEPWLAADIIIAQELQGYVEYDFESPLAGDAYIYCRVMDLRGEFQSWWVILNSDDHVKQGVRFPTAGAWVWNTGRWSLRSLTQLKKGKNTIRVVPRETAPGAETLMDVLVVSTVAFKPTAEAFNNATAYGAVPVITGGKIVNPGEQFTVDISARLGADPLHRFRFDLVFDPSILQAAGVKEGTLLSENGAQGTVWEPPQVDNEKGVIADIQCRRTGKAGATEKGGALAAVTFKALQTGRSKLSLRNLHLFAPNGEALTAWSRDGWVNTLPHARISGRVTDERGTPIPYASVRLERNNLEIARTRTDGLGRYRLRIDASPVSGRYDLSATYETLAAWRLGFPLKVSDRQRINLTLKEAISISGTLLMLDDKTPHLAIVVQAVIPGPPLSPQIWGDKGGRRGVGGEGEPIVIATTLSNEAGIYQFVNLKPGPYQIRCYTLNGYIYYQPMTDDKDEPEILTVKHNRPLSNIDFRIPPFKKGAWRHLDYYDGLADNSVSVIYRDRDELLWFGTDNGVSRYDGAKFVNFTTRDRLPHNAVISIYQDSNGVMWFGTMGGISRYDGTEFVNYFTAKDGLPGNRGNSIYQDADGVMWFGTIRGVFRYDPSAERAGGEEFVNFTKKMDWHLTMSMSSMVTLMVPPVGWGFKATCGLGRVVVYRAMMESVSSTLPPDWGLPTSWTFIVPPMAHCGLGHSPGTGASLVTMGRNLSTSPQKMDWRVMISLPSITMRTARSGLAL